MAKRPEPAPDRPVTRDDLQRGFAGVQRSFQRQVEDRKSTIVSVVAGIGAVVVVIVFLLGRRSGKKKSTFVEIRRV
jgi:hypothetical protein